MTTLECPECGRPFDGQNALANHLHKRGDHGPTEWADALEIASSAEAAVDSLTADGGAGLEAGDDDDDEEPDADPTVSAGDGPERELPACPECGGRNLFDPTEYYPRFRYGCRDCSDSETWEVFNG